MASFRKRVGGWRAEIAILGTRESKTFSTKAEAAAWASERETEIRRGADSGIVIGKSCGDAFDRYLEEVSIHKRGDACLGRWHCRPPPRLDQQKRCAARCAAIDARAGTPGAAAGPRRGAIIRHFHSLARCPVPQSAPALLHRGTDLPRQPACRHHAIGKEIECAGPGAHGRPQEFAYVPNLLQRERRGYGSQARVGAAI